MRYNLVQMKKVPTHTKTHLLDEQSLRDTLRFWATGVTIVSVAHQGVQHGMTVNSFASLSLEPPLVLVSLERGTRTHDLVDQAGVFAVSLLGQGQEALSERFAGRESEESDRFLNVETFTEESGSPILKEGLSFFDCRVQSSHAAGSHTIFVGEVLVTGLLPSAQSEQAPLVYYNRNYRRLTDS